MPTPRLSQDLVQTMTTMGHFSHGHSLRVKLLKKPHTHGFEQRDKICRYPMVTTGHV